jgi:non-specific serine/threonine protein kinase/serine/threonine-protein kinase
MAPDSPPEPAPEAAVGTTHNVPAVTLDGGSIGPYRLIRKLGEGGMGVVFHAQQTEPIRRDVALKVIRPGMDSQQVITRFESERQALALMEHSNIAYVLDAGTTEAGLPYFVMELVDGVPITRYCDRNRLPLRARIELFLLVCSAIQHAHQKGIIHRDIKPSNILVKNQDGRDVLKVIDFGLSKALGGKLADVSVSGFGAVVGTLRYMSPEQAEATRRDVDTRSDIYSLGVLLYELLTGSTPLEYDAPEASLLDSLRRIREDEAEAPSTRLRQSPRLSEVALLRATDALRLPAQVDHELDWITLKALEKDRTDRYETVSALARDLERYLTGEPVDAAPPSTAYRVRKLVRKHRVGLATAAGFLLLAIAAAIGGVWLAIRANRAEQEARAVSSFLRDDVLAQASPGTQANPSTRPDQNLTVRMALDRAATRIGGRFAGEPLVEATVRQTIGNTYSDLGVYDKAQEQIERALALRRQLLGDVDPETLASTLSLALVFEQRGRYEDAERLLLPLLDELRRERGTDHPDTVEAAANVGRLFWQQGKYAEAEPILEAALAGQRRALGDDDPVTLTTMNILAGTYFSQGKYAEAEPLYRTILDRRRRVLGGEHPSTVISMSNLAGQHRVRGRYDEAEELYREVRDVRMRVLGAEHPDTLAAVYNIAALYQAVGRNLEAEPLFRQVLDARRRILGPDHPRTLATEYGLAVLMRGVGNLPEAETHLSAVLAGRRRTLGEEHPDTLDTETVLAQVQIAAGRFTQAERALRNVLRIYDETDVRGWQRAVATANLGESLLGQRRHAAAEPLLLEGYQALQAQRDEIPADEQKVFDDVRGALHRLYLESGRPEKASAWERAPDSDTTSGSLRRE